jgi:C4-dicarboxylate transporter
VLLAIPPVMLLLAQATLNPIIAVTLLGAVLPPPAALGVTPTALGLAYLCAWAVSAAMTPMSASAITTARWAGGVGEEVSPYDVTNRWNRGFVAGQMLLAWAAIAIAA